MAASTIAITCPANVWTEIASGVASVAFRWRDERYYGKWVIGQGSAPAINTTHFMTLPPRAPQSLNDLALTDKVWVMPWGGTSQVIEVTRA